MTTICILRICGLFVLIVGGRKASQLEQNIEAIAAAKKLTPEVLKKIEEILDNKPKLQVFPGPIRSGSDSI